MTSTRIRNSQCIIFILSWLITRLLKHSIKLTVIWENNQHHIALFNEVAEYFCINFCPCCILVCNFCIRWQAKSLNDWKIEKVIFKLTPFLASQQMTDLNTYIFMMQAKCKYYFSFFSQCMPFYRALYDKVEIIDIYTELHFCNSYRNEAIIQYTEFIRF